MYVQFSKGLEMITDFQLELLALIQLITHAKVKDEHITHDRRKSCRRQDRRKHVYKRTSISSDVHYDKINDQEQDRRNPRMDRRKRDRRALERIKNI